MQLSKQYRKKLQDGIVKFACANATVWNNNTEDWFLFMKTLEMK